MKESQEDGSGYQGPIQLKVQDKDRSGSVRPAPGPQGARGAKGLVQDNVFLPGFVGPVKKSFGVDITNRRQLVRTLLLRQECWAGCGVGSQGQRET